MAGIAVTRYHCAARRGEETTFRQTRKEPDGGQQQGFVDTADGRRRLLLLATLFIFTFAHSREAADAPTVLGVLADEDGVLDVGAVSAVPPGEWLHPDQRSFGFSDAVYWVRFVINRPVLPEHWILEVPFAPLDEIDLYRETVSGIEHVGTGGDMRPFHDRDLPHRHSTFVIEPEQAAGTTWYLRVHSQGSVQLPLRLWTAHDFFESVSNGSLAYGAYYGAMMLLFLAACLAFWHLRDSLFGLFAGYVLGTQSSMFMLNGFAAKYLWPGSRWRPTTPSQ